MSTLIPVGLSIFSSKIHSVSFFLYSLGHITQISCGAPDILQSTWTSDQVGYMGRPASN